MSAQQNTAQQQYLCNKKNALLQKTEIGKCKNSTYDLPQEQQFFYGKSAGKDKENAKEVSMTWQYHNNSQPAKAKRDFTKMNIASLKNGVVNSKQLKDYRGKNEVRVQVKEGTLEMNIELPPEEFVFGKPNKPSTPINHVLSNSYGLESEQFLNKLYEVRYYEKQQVSQTKQKVNVKENKTSKLNSEKNKKKLDDKGGAEAKQQFKLKKFQNVQPKTNTYSLKQGKKQEGEGASQPQNNEQLQQQQAEELEQQQ